MTKRRVVTFAGAAVTLVSLTGCAGQAALAPGTPLFAYHASGSGTDSGGLDVVVYVVASDWRLSWSYTCPPPGGMFGLQVFKGARVQGMTPLAQANKAGSFDVHGGGKYTLVLVSKCAWTAKGVAL